MAKRDAPPHGRAGSVPSRAVRAVPCLAVTALVLASCGGGHSTGAPEPPASTTAPGPSSTSTPPSSTTTTTPLLRGWSTHRLVAQLVMLGARYADPAASAAAVRDGAG